MGEKKPRAAWAVPGDMLQIPYDGEKAIWGRVVYNDARGTKKRRGLYFTVLDRDVVPGDDLREVAGWSPMLGPLHATADLVKDGTWKIAGAVPPTEAEQALPYFEDRIGVIDYFFERVPDIAENRARMVDEYVMAPESVVEVVRAVRGLDPWLPGYERYRSKKRS